MINFILINSAISSCLQNLHRARLRDGSAERGCRQTHDSLLRWCYIYLTAGEGGLGKGAERCLPAASQCHFPNALCLPRPGLLAVVGGQTSPRLSCRQGGRLGDRDVSPTSASSFPWSLWWFAGPHPHQHPHLEMEMKRLPSASWALRTS